jgi:hypothetical protein
MTVLDQTAVALDWNTVRALSERDAAPSVSLYLPTHQYGAEMQQDPVRLANLMAAARDQAKALGWSRERLHAILRPAQATLENREFWRHQSIGLGVLLSADDAYEFKLDTPVQEFACAGGRFCLRPLIPSVALANHEWYVLALSQNDVRLLRCSARAAETIALEGAPRCLEDSAGHDYEERSVQFHTGAAQRGGGTRAAQFHGQGRASDKRDQEIEQFLRRVHDGITAELADSSTPVVLACVDSLQPIFQRVNKSLNVLDNAIDGNPDERSDEDLRASGLRAARAHFEADTERVLEFVRENAGTDKVCAGIADVLPFAQQGRMQALIVDCAEPLWGRYEGARVRVYDEQTWRPDADDLIDRAISFALSTGAELYPVKTGALPNGMSRLAGIRRF